MPQLRWTLSIYEINLTDATTYEMTISKYIRKWLGLHQSTTKSALYSSQSPCLLPLKSFVSVLKASKVRFYLFLRDSSDPLISTAIPKLKIGSSWHVVKAVKEAESTLKFRDMFGPFRSPNNRAGIGLIPIEHTPKKGTKPYRKLIAGIVAKKGEEDMFSKAVQLSVQIYWLLG